MGERGMVAAFFVATLSFFVSSVALAYEAVEMKGGGTITGKVKFTTEGSTQGGN